MPPLSERATYRSDGGVSWGRLPLMLVTAFLMGASGGWVLYFLFAKGFYYVFICPILVSLGIAFVMGTATKSAHCRNTWVALVMSAALSEVCRGRR